MQWLLNLLTKLCCWLTVNLSYFPAKTSISTRPPFFQLDSIVRGTTSKEIVQMAKDVGAKKVIVASCAPPIRLVTFVIKISP